jgi:hypothetical protein
MAPFALEKILHRIRNKYFMIRVPLKKDFASELMSFCHITDSYMKAYESPSIRYRVYI